MNLKGAWWVCELKLLKGPQKAFCSFANCMSVATVWPKGMRLSKHVETRGHPPQHCRELSTNFNVWHCTPDFEVSQSHSFQSKFDGRICIDWMYPVELPMSRTQNEGETVLGSICLDYVFKALKPTDVDTEMAIRHVICFNNWAVQSAVNCDNSNPVAYKPTLAHVGIQCRVYRCQRQRPK